MVTSINLKTDAGAVGDGVTDDTLAFAIADKLARDNSVRTVIVPNGTYLVSTASVPSSGPYARTDKQNIIRPSYARKWLGDWDSSVIKVKANDPMLGQEVTIWLQSGAGLDNSELIFKLDGNGANQIGTGSLTNSGFVGRPTGFRCYGLKLSGVSHPQVHVKVFNTRSISATGVGSTFAMQSIQGIGGDFWLHFETDDGSIGSEGAVFQGKTLETDAEANPWKVHYLRSKKMWRGFGCFSGGWGVVDGLDVVDLTGPYDSAAPPALAGPGRKVRGNAINIESGCKFVSGTTTPIPGSGTKSVVVNAPQSLRADQFFVTTNNYGNATESITINNGRSTNDVVGITFAGNLIAESVDLIGCHFQAPTIKIVEGNAAQRTNLTFTSCTYSAGSTVGDGAPHTGLTVGSPSGNTAPALSAMLPTTSSTVTSSSVVTVSVAATDDGPFASLSATGQAYLPAVTITSLQVAGLTATIITATAHNATTGAAVRIAGVTPTSWNKKWSNCTVVNSTTLTIPITGTPTNGTAFGTLEPYGSAIAMTPIPDTGRFTGTWTAPAADGQVRRIEVTVTDSASTPLSTTLATVLTTDALTVDTASPLPDAVVGDAYSQTITASGGSGTRTWATSGLPAHGITAATVSEALVLTATTLTGADGDVLTFTATVTRSGVSVAKTFTIPFRVIEDPDTDPPIVTAISLADGTTITTLTELTATITDISGVATAVARLTSPAGTIIELPMVEQ